MKFFAAIVSLVAASAAGAKTTHTAPLNKDVGLVYTNMKCGSDPCSQTNLHGQTSYMAYLGNKDFRRIIMGFEMPKNIDQSKIKSCSLMMPASLQAGSTANYYNLIVRPLNSDFDAETVTPMTAPGAGDVIGQTTANDGTPPPPIDVTSACRNPNDGIVDLAIDATGAPAQFPSLAGGSNAHLMIVME
ncbi:hypothetical protein J3B02_004196 [Coemansia erecta]|uniref:Uncharacterized protein n=1 Tax=Coemansia asiatica TaxID=1052880 RepID=A0A9W8CHI6_9FUNG|nr:hypothetical protein LPJ64_005584 [Coemansia asiatica]KAJ2847323.1 hypothetical protein J3B02_004196 [Coemansia erecta]KAJ2877531.1 hypothetical protein FB639_003713 [Coemansia asiatica]